MSMLLYKVRKSWRALASKIRAFLINFFRFLFSCYIVILQMINFTTVNDDNEQERRVRPVLLLVLEKARHLVTID